MTVQKLLLRVVGLSAWSTAECRLKSFPVQIIKPMFVKRRGRGRGRFVMNTFCECWALLRLHGVTNQTTTNVHMALTILAHSLGFSLWKQHRLRQSRELPALLRQNLSGEGFPMRESSSSDIRAQKGIVCSRNGSDHNQNWNVPTNNSELLNIIFNETHLVALSLLWRS